MQVCHRNALPKILKYSCVPSVTKQFLKNIFNGNNKDDIYYTAMFYHLCINTLYFVLLLSCRIVLLMCTVVFLKYAVVFCFFQFFWGTHYTFFEGRFNIPQPLFHDTRCPLGMIPTHIQEKLTVPVCIQNGWFVMVIQYSNELYVQMAPDLSHWYPLQRDRRNSGIIPHLKIFSVMWFRNTR